MRFGVFGPGDWLKLVDLQSRYDATQFEARKLLSELKNEGLVEHKINAGFRVASPDPLEREQMRYVRSVLERSAAPLIAARATEQDICDLERIAEEFDMSISSQGRQRQAQTNREFHDRLYGLAGNTVLINLIHDLRERSHYGTTGRWNDDSGLKASSEEHMKIIEALRRRDPHELERLIVQHIESF